MKDDELLTHANCSLCGQKIGACGSPFFWRVVAERFAVDLRRVQQTDGLAMMLGSAQLARVMGPNHDVANPIQGPTMVTVCNACAEVAGPMLHDAISAALS